MSTRTCIVAALLVALLTTPHALAIVGGTKASPNEYPWMAAIYNDDPSYGQFCGGTLVDPDTVVTAAHCMEGLLGIQFIDGFVDALLYGETMVLLGREKLSGSGGEEIEVSDVIIHPDYYGGENDIAIIKLDTPSSQTPIAYAKPSQSSLWAAGTMATVTGWGLTRENGSGSDDLREVDVPIVSDKDCDKAYGNIDHATELCAGYPQGGKDSCQGDSGGPLIVPAGGGKYILAGVVSWGNGCARAGYPGVYAEVGGLSSFIDANL